MGCCESKNAVGDEHELQKRASAAKKEKARPDRGDFLTKVERAKKTRLLNVSGEGLVTMPVEVVEMEGLKALDMSECKLREFGVAEGWKESMKTLTLTKNALTEVGGGIPGLSNLQVLSMSHNPIRWLPDLSGLTHLRDADFSHCKLENLNNPLPPALISLNVSHNLLASIPSLTHSRLNTLNLSHNSLTSFTLVSLPSLRTLDLSSNRIASLPEELFTATELHGLTILDNPLTEDALKKMPCYNIWVQRQATTINKKIQGGAVVELIK